MNKKEIIQMAILKELVNIKLLLEGIFEDCDTSMAQGYTGETIKLRTDEEYTNTIDEIQKDLDDSVLDKYYYKNESQNS